MGGKSLEEIISRAMSDPAFRTQLVSDPEGIAAAHGLSAAEIEALTSGDSSRLRAMGVSEQLSRFTLIELPH